MSKKQYTRYLIATSTDFQNSFRSYEQKSSVLFFSDTVYFLLHFIGVLYLICQIFNLLAY